MEEKLRILKMVEDGTITAEQAGELLKALEGSGAPQDAGWEYPVPAADAPYEDRLFRILVDSSEGDRVRVQLPVKVIRVIMGTVGKLPIGELKGLKDVDLEQLTDTVLQCLSSEVMGDIVEVSSADGDKVRIYIG